MFVDNCPFCLFVLYFLYFSFLLWMVHLNEGALNLLFLNLLSHFTGFWTSKQIYCIAYNCCWMYFFVLICVFGLCWDGGTCSAGKNGELGCSSYWFWFWRRPAPPTPPTLAPRLVLLLLPVCFRIFSFFFVPFVPWISWGPDLLWSTCGTRNNLKRVTSCWRKKVTHVRLAECFTDSIVHGRDIRFCLF